MLQIYIALFSHFNDIFYGNLDALDYCYSNLILWDMCIVDSLGQGQAGALFNKGHRMKYKV